MTLGKISLNFVENVGIRDGIPLTARSSDFCTLLNFSKLTFQDNHQSVKQF